MKKSVIKLIAVCLTGFGLADLQAQESFVSAGGKVLTDQFTVSYSVGQPFYSILTGVGGSLTMGVQQAYDISVNTGIDEKNITLACSAYPNPTTDRLILKMEGATRENLVYQLLDMQGKVLETKKVTGNQADILMRVYNQGTYLLTVTDGKDLLKSFRIIKN